MHYCWLESCRGWRQIVQWWYWGPANCKLTLSYAFDREVWSSGWVKASAPKISMQYQADKWWEQRKILFWELLVDPIPNSPNLHHKRCVADSKENYWREPWIERVERATVDGRHWVTNVSTTRAEILIRVKFILFTPRSYPGLRSIRL